MFRIFKKQNRNSPAYPLWQKINDSINTRARKWANWLNAKMEKISRKNMEYLLVVFCIFWGAASMYIIMRAVQKKINPFSVSPVSVPKHIVPAVTAIPDTSLQNAVKRIEHFKAWLDSLHDTRNPRYESIIRERPGLLDSIRFIEQYYSSKK